MQMRTVSLVWLAVLAACHGAPDKAPRAALRVDVVGEMAPGPVLDGPRAVLTQSTQAGLVALDANGEVVPALATSWRVSDDGLSIIFRLRDAKWQDGRSVTAGDVVAVYRRLLGPGGNHPLAGLLTGIVNADGRKPAKSMGVSDPLHNIVEIRLTAPQPELLQLLASPSMTIVRRGASAPSNGAFLLDDAAARPLALRRNDAYFDSGAVPLGTIALLPAGDPQTAITRFQRRETDVVIGRSLAGLAAADKFGAALRLDPTPGSYGYIANLKRGPLADPRVRRALAMAADREGLVAGLTRLRGVKSLTSLVPVLRSDPEPARPDWSDWLPDARIAEATRLLAEAGYGPDKPLSVSLLLPPGDEHRMVLAAVAAGWVKLGVQTIAIEKGGKDFAASVAQGRFDLAVAERHAVADTPLFFLAPFRCAAARTCNRAADALLASARVTPNAVERAQTIRKAEQMIADDTPEIVLLAVPRWALVAARVSGWSPNALSSHPLSRLDVLPPG